MHALDNQLGDLLALHLGDLAQEYLATRILIGPNARTMVEDNRSCLDAFFSHVAQDVAYNAAEENYLTLTVDDLTLARVEAALRQLCPRGSMGVRFGGVYACDAISRFLRSYRLLGVVGHETYFSLLGVSEWWCHPDGEY